MAEDRSVKSQIKEKRKQLKGNVSEIRKKVTGNTELAEADFVERWKNRIKTFKDDKGPIREKIDEYEPGRNIAKIVGNEDQGVRSKIKGRREKRSQSKKQSRQPPKEKPSGNNQQSPQKEIIYVDAREKTQNDKSESNEKSKPSNPKESKNKEEDDYEVIL